MEVTLGVLKDTCTNHWMNGTEEEAGRSALQNRQHHALNLEEGEPWGPEAHR